MRFVYQGRERFQGLWHSPTPCGMYMAAVALLCFGGALWFWQRDRKIGAVAAFVAGLGFEWLLLITYSRAAYVSFMAGLLLFGRLKPRSISIGGLIGFLAIGALVPGGVSRMAAIADRDEVPVRNRLLIWASTSVMITDNAWSGYRDRTFHEVHKAWYGSEIMKNAVYRTAVNGFVHCGARFGVPALAGCVILAFWVFGLQATLGLVRGSLHHLTAAALAGVYIVGNVFSTQYELMLWNTIALGLLGLSGWDTGRLWQDNRSAVGWLAGATLAVSGAVVGGVWALGEMHRARQPYTLVSQGHQLGGSRYSLVRLIPRTVARPAVLFCIMDPLPQRRLQPLAVQLARQGNQVVYAETGARGGGYTELERIRVLVRDTLGNATGETKTWCLVGTGASTQPAFVMGCDESSVGGVVAVNLMVHSPFPLLSPESNVKRFKSRLLLIADQAGAAQESDRREFVSRCNELGLRFETADSLEDSDLVGRILQWWDEGPPKPASESVAKPLG